MVFQIPLSPKVGNARGHWKAIHYGKKAYWKMLDARQNIGLLPAPPATPYPKVDIAATFYLWNEMDTDNATSRLKHAADWLVTRGYIVGDRPAQLNWTQLVQVIDRRHQRLELTLEPA